METTLVHGFGSSLVGAAGCLLALTGCDTPPQVLAIGEFDGRDAAGTEQVETVLEVGHRDGASAPPAPDPALEARLDIVDAAKLVTSMERVRLRLDVNHDSEPYTERFLLLSQVYANSPWSETTDVPGWVRARLPAIRVLSVREGDDIQSSAGLPVLPPGATAWRPGAHYLVRVEDDDRRLPWRIVPGSPGCMTVSSVLTLVAPAPGETEDCFDFETLAGLLFMNVARRVAEGFRDAKEGLEFTLRNHTLRVVPYMESPGAGLPGFGVIYSVELIGKAAGLPALTATVYAPLSVHFSLGVSAAAPYYELAIDPATPFADGARNPARVTITAAGPVAGEAAARIRDVIAAGLSEVALPDVGLGEVTVGSGDDAQSLDLTLPTETVLSNLLQFAMAAPASAVDVGYRVVALPVAQTGEVSSTILSMSSVAIADTLINPPETIGNSSVSVMGTAVQIRTITEPEGKVARTVKFAPLVRGEPYDLMFLEVVGPGS